MSKFGMNKGSVHDRADAEQVAHRHVPGRAYNVADPVTKFRSPDIGPFRPCFSVICSPESYENSERFREFILFRCV